MAEDNKKSAIDRDKFYWKNDPILSRFSFAFSKKVNINPMYHAAFTMLQQGIDEYVVIEELLKSNEKLCNELIKASKNQLPKYFIKNGTLPI